MKNLTLNKLEVISEPTPIKALNELALKMHKDGFTIISRVDRFKDMSTNSGWFSANKNGVFIHISSCAGWRGKFSMSIEYIPSREYGSGHGVLDQLYDEDLTMENINKVVKFYNNYRGGAKKYSSLDEYLSTRGKFYNIDIYDFKSLMFLKEWVNFDKDNKKV